MSLIQLEIRGHIIKVPEGTSISYVEESSLISNEYHGGEYSLGFSLPKTPILNELFQYSFNPESVTKRQVVENCRLLYSGAIWKEGKITVKGAGAKYRCYIQTGLSSALAEYMEKSIRSFDLPTYDLGADPYDFAKSVALSPLSYDFNFFPVEAPNFSSNSKWSGVVNWYNNGSEEFYVNSNYSGDPEFESILSPYARLVRVYELILNSLGYTVESDLLSHTDVRRICLITPFHIGELSTAGGAHVGAKSTFNMTDILPDITLEELIFEFNQLFCASLRIDERDKIARVNRRDQILSSSNLYKFQGSVISNPETILDESRKDLYFKFSDNTSYFIPESRDEMIESKAQVLPMVVSTVQFGYSDNASYVGPDGIVTFLPQIDFEMDKSIFGEDSADFNSIIPCYSDGYAPPITAAQDPTNSRPQRYPQSHTIRYRDTQSDLDEIFGYLSGTLSWDGSPRRSNFDTEPNPEDGLYHEFWREWTLFYASSKKVKLQLLPTAEDVIMVTSENKTRILNFNLLPLSITTQMNDNTIVEIITYVI